MPEVEQQRRTIRSFVIRGGRMTEAQQKAYDAHWGQWGLEPNKEAVEKTDFAEVFGRTAPLVVEIGFGMGGSLAEMAEQAPEKNFVGIEVHRPGVGKLMHTMQEKGIDNIRIYCHDAVEVLANNIADNSIDTFQIFFPDPWHKKKHHKRRLIQPEFVQKLRAKLKVGGVLHLATDWEHYAEQMLEVLGTAEGYKNLSENGSYVLRPEHRPLTKFEQRGERLGHGVWDLMFEKV